MASMPQEQPVLAYAGAGNTTTNPNVLFSGNSHISAFRTLNRPSGGRTSRRGANIVMMAKPPAVEEDEGLLDNIWDKL